METNTKKPIVESISLRNSCGQVIDTGSVLVFGNEPLTFTFDNLDFKVVFLSDNNSKEASMEAGVKKENDEPQYFEIKIINADGERFVGCHGPFEVALFQGHQLLLSFSIHGLPSGNKVFFYTWILGDEVKKNEAKDASDDSNVENACS